MGIAAVAVTSVTNRVLYKMAMVPMGNYVAFLALFQTLAYVVFYFATLAIRVR